MIPFQVAEALRRVRRRRARPHVRVDAGLPLWRLLGGEVAHQVRRVPSSPAVAVAVSGVVTSLGVYVALGPGYPGPVAPAAARWVLVGAVLVATAGLARGLPRRWSDVGRAVRRGRPGLVVLGAAAAISVLKVGLHDMTPGPVLPAPLRWAAVVAVAVLATVLARGRHDPS